MKFCKGKFIYCIILKIMCSARKRFLSTASCLVYCQGHLPSRSSLSVSVIHCRTLKDLDCFFGLVPMLILIGDSSISDLGPV